VILIKEQLKEKHMLKALSKKKAQKKRIVLIFTEKEK